MSKSDYLSEKGVDEDKGLVWFVEVYHDEDSSPPLDYMDGAIHCGFEGRTGARWRGGYGEISEMESAVGAGWSAEEGGVVVGDAYNTPRAEEEACALACRLILLESSPDLIDEWFDEVAEKNPEEFDEAFLAEHRDYPRKLAFFLSKVDEEWVREQSYSDYMPSGVWSDIEQRTKELMEKDLDARVQGDKYAVQLSYIDGYSKTLKVSYFSSPLSQAGWSAMEQGDGVWVPDKDLRAELERMPYHEAMGRAKSVAEAVAPMVAAHLSGEVYWYRICVFPLQYDEDDEPIDSLSYYEDEMGEAPLFDENCSGFYGDEALKEDISMSVESALTCAMQELALRGASELENKEPEQPSAASGGVSMKMM